MLTLLMALLIGTLVVKYALNMGKLFLEEIKWLNKGISELVVPRKQK
tara:strand:+ start:49 stop:189 length:141 start_codon:yes stop_codon:yes gene_type:complete